MSDATQPVVALACALAGRWSEKFEGLPAPLRERVVNALSVFGQFGDWDALTPEQRRAAIEQHDCQQDSRLEPALYFELTALRDTLSERVAEAKANSEYGAALALKDVDEDIAEILAADRSQVGDEVQALRRVRAQLSTIEEAASRLLQEREAAWAAERDALLRERDDLRTALATPASRWPWGTHETEALRHLAAAAVRFWKNFDPGDNTTAPTNAEVEAWLKSRGVAQRTAEVMASILRADGLPTGPRT